MRNITIVDWEDGDWIALYVDGKLVHDGHSISGTDMLRYLDIDFEDVDVPDHEDAFMLCGVEHLNDLKEQLEELE